MRFLIPVLFLLAALPAHAAQITGIRIEASAGGEHVSLRLNECVRAKVFAIETLPPRVVVDIPAARWRDKAALPQDYHGELVKGVRFGMRDANTGRTVFDLSATAQPRNVQTIEAHESGGCWVEFDLAANYSPKRHRVNNDKANAPEKPLVPEKPVIVIDAGHGGQDPGTAGYSGSHEKDLTLRYALALRDALEDTGRYRVFLTRSDDTYLLLRERVRRARAAKGNLFISLHADSGASDERGLSIYTISEHASDKESAALAAKENKADVIGGMDLSGASEDVVGILVELAERETRAKSDRFAELAARDLGREVHLLSHTHRFAGFAVLKAPDIPSVLVEVGFLTNPREERQLQSASYEHRIVRALSRAVEGYFSKRK